MRKILLFVFGTFLLHFANAQQNISVCYNGSTTVSFTDASTTDKYLWQTKPTAGSTWTTVKNWSTDKFVNLTNLTASLNVRYLVDTVVYDQIGEDTVIIANITVHPDFVAGSISSPQTICYNTAPSQLTATNCSGGATPYSYQWEKSANGTSGWTNATGTGATTLNFTPSALTVTTYFRLKYTSGSSCGTVYSNVIQITVYPNMVAATIGSVQTICYNTAPSALSIQTAATGGNGSFSNQWQEKNDENWEDITGQTGNAYQPSNPTNTTQYRLKSTSDYGCGAVYSNEITITVYADINSGVIGNSQTVCYNTAPSQFNFTTNPSGAGGNYTYQWQSSTDNSNFSNIPSATNSTYQAGNLTITTTYYRVIVTSTVCGTSATSNVITVTVRPDFVAGSISSPQTICYNTVPNPLVGTNCIGGATPYSYQWEKSANGTSGWTNATGTGATTLNFTPSVLSATTYFRLKYTSSSSCGTLYSNVIQLTVYPNMAAATIGSAQTICYNTAPSALSIQTAATGGNDSFSNQWQVKNGANWEDITGQTGNAYQPSNLTNTTQYRLKSTSDYGCGAVYSNTITITVYADINSGVIENSQIICYNSAPTQFSFTTNPSGADGNYTYQWQSSTDNVTFTNISSATNNTYQAGNLTDTTYYKVVVTSTTCGTSATSNVITVTVRPDFVAGTISSQQTICYNIVPTQLVGTNCTGGATPYSYQWEKSANGTSGWIDATGTGATTLNFTPSVLTATTYFRLKYTSGCGTVYSNVIQITVYPNMAAATIGSVQTICYNTVPSALSIQTAATGGNDSFSNQWQVKNGANWEDIIGQTGNAYQPSNLTNTTQYRLKSTSDYGCGEVYSNEITITVYAEINSGTIINSQTICYNFAPTQFSFTTNPSGAGGTYTYQWQSSTDNVTFTNITSATNNTFQAENLTQTTYYCVVVTSTICGTSATSNAVTVTVRDEFLPGTVSTPQTICYNTVPNQLVGTNCTGGATSYSYQWEKSANGTTGWTDAIGTGATTLNFTPSALTATTYFRLKYTSGSSCGTVYSNVIQITVYPNMVAATIGSAQTICYNTAPSALSIQTAATGGNDSFSNQWQVKNGTNWEDITGQTGNAYQPSNLSTTTQYRLKSTSDYGCGEVYSNEITITVYADINSGVIGGTQTICYNTAPTQFSFTTNPSGEGGIYTFQWQSSTDNITFTNIPNATNNTYQAGILITTTYYRVIVTSTTCGTSATSNVDTVTVLPDFITGEIAGEDTICQNVVPREIRTIVNCSGADGNYSYQWQESIDNVTFTDISDATNQNYQPPALTQTTYYRLRFSSDYGCGVLYSNSVKVWVIPAPTERILIGKMSVCNNTYDLEYSFAETEENITYEWSIEGGEITKQIDDRHIIVHWDNQAGNGIITLQQANVLTNCYLITDYIIVKTDNSAPSKMHILKKENSNILICEDNSLGIHYEWGFENLQTNQEIMIENSDCQYIIIPHSIDTTKYDYFVRTWFEYGRHSCETKTYWLKDVIENDMQPQHANLSFRIAPNPAKKHFSVTLENPIEDKFTVSVQTLTGQTICQQQFSEYKENEKIDFSLSLAKGLYLIVVRTKNEVSTSKIVIE